jgi:hypothetical protein
MTRLEAQLKLIAKFGNTLNKQDKKRFETFYLRTLKLPTAVMQKFTTVEREGEEEVTHQILSEEIKVNAALITPLFVALKKLSDSPYKNEVLGNILCYAPALMPDSETTVCYTSFGLAFRFDQENELSSNAAQFFIDMGFIIGNDKDNKPYFIYDIIKILK